MSSSPTAAPPDHSRRTSETDETTQRGPSSDAGWMMSPKPDQTHPEQPQQCPSPPPPPRSRRGKKPMPFGLFFLFQLLVLLCAGAIVIHCLIVSPVTPILSTTTTTVAFASSPSSWTPAGVRPNAHDLGNATAVEWNPAPQPSSSAAAVLEHNSSTTLPLHHHRRHHPSHQTASASPGDANEKKEKETRESVTDDFSSYVDLLEAAWRRVAEQEDPGDKVKETVKRRMPTSQQEASSSLQPTMVEEMTRSERVTSEPSAPPAFTPLLSSRLSSSFSSSIQKKKAVVTPRTMWWYLLLSQSQTTAAAGDPHDRAGVTTGMDSFADIHIRVLLLSEKHAPGQGAANSLSSSETAAAPSMPRERLIPAKTVRNALDTIHERLRMQRSSPSCAANGARGGGGGASPSSLFQYTIERHSHSRLTDDDALQTAMAHFKAAYPDTTRSARSSASSSSSPPPPPWEEAFGSWMANSLLQTLHLDDFFSSPVSAPTHATEIPYANASANASANGADEGGTSSQARRRPPPPRPRRGQRVMVVPYTLVLMLVPEAAFPSSPSPRCYHESHHRLPDEPNVLFTPPPTSTSLLYNSFSTASASSPSKGRPHHAETTTTTTAPRRRQPRHSTARGAATDGKEAPAQTINPSHHNPLDHDFFDPELPQSSSSSSSGWWWGSFIQPVVSPHHRDPVVVCFIPQQDGGADGALHRFSSPLPDTATRTREDEEDDENDSQRNEVVHIEHHGSSTTTRHTNNHNSTRNTVRSAVQGIDIHSVESAVTSAFAFWLSPKPTSSSLAAPPMVSLSNATEKSLNVSDSALGHQHYHHRHNVSLSSRFTAQSLRTQTALAIQEAQQHARFHLHAARDLVRRVYPSVSQDLFTLAQHRLQEVEDEWNMVQEWTTSTKSQPAGAAAGGRKAASIRFSGSRWFPTSLGGAFSESTSRYGVAAMRRQHLVLEPAAARSSSSALSSSSSAGSSFWTFLRDRMDALTHPGAWRGECGVKAFLLAAIPDFFSSGFMREDLFLVGQSTPAPPPHEAWEELQMQGHSSPHWMVAAVQDIHAAMDRLVLLLSCVLPCDSSTDRVCPNNTQIGRGDLEGWEASCAASATVASTWFALARAAEAHHLELRRAIHQLLWWHAKYNGEHQKDPSSPDKKNTTRADMDYTLTPPAPYQDASCQTLFFCRLVLLIPMLASTLMFLSSCLKQRRAARTRRSNSGSAVEGGTHHRLVRSWCSTTSCTSAVCTCPDPVSVFTAQGLCCEQCGRPCVQGCFSSPPVSCVFENRSRRHGRKRNADSDDSAMREEDASLEGQNRNSRVECFLSSSERGDMPSFFPAMNAPPGIPHGMMNTCLESDGAAMRSEQKPAHTTAALMGEDGTRYDGTHSSSHLYPNGVENAGVGGGCARSSSCAGVFSSPMAAGVPLFSNYAPPCAGVRCGDGVAYHSSASMAFTSSPLPSQAQPQSPCALHFPSGKAMDNGTTSRVSYAL